MSTIAVNAITDASGGNTAQINGATPTNDNLMGRNRVINGAMEISQRGTSAVTVNTSTNFYPVDRFAGYGSASDGVFTLQKSTTAPAGFLNSIIATVTTADASVGASQYYLLAHRIEGTNVADLGWGTANAKTVTLSFWVRSSLTGTFGGSLANSAYNRAYPFTYSISAADTWEYKTITVAGDTTGTWLTTTGLGLRVYWDLGSGSDAVNTAGAWLGSGAVGATGGVKLISTLNATWYITGVQLEAGSVATSFERRMYPQELQLCQRYFFKKQAESVDALQLPVPYNGSTSNSWITYFYPVEMRALPTFANPYNFYGSSPYLVNAGIRNASMRWLVGTDYMQGATTFDLSAEL